MAPGPVDITELLKKKPTSLPTNNITSSSETIQDALVDIITSIREKIVIQRAITVCPGAGELLCSYVHGRVGIDVLPSFIQMGKIGSVVTMSTSPNVESGSDTLTQCQDIGKKIAMHVAAADPAPLYLQSTDVPQDLIDRETAIFRWVLNLIKYVCA